jgi:hypothetical protein
MARAKTKSDIWDSESRRTTPEGEKLGLDLLERLGVCQADVTALMADDSVKRAVTRWGIEFANVRWYSAEIPRLERYFNVSRWLSLLLGMATIAGTAALALIWRDIGFAQLAVLTAGIFGVIQLFAVGTDPKARLGAFRKAKADLMEALYTFEQTWTGHVLDGNSTGTSRAKEDFMTALLQEIRTARKIVRDERDAFFATFKSPSEILGAAGSALDALRGRRTELAGGIKEAAAPATAREAAVAARIDDLRTKLDEAKALKAALEEKKARLEKAGAPELQLDDLQAKIEEAETDRARNQCLLGLAVKSDVAHPI